MGDKFVKRAKRFRKMVCVLSRDMTALVTPANSISLDLLYGAPKPIAPSRSLRRAPHPTYLAARSRMRGPTCGCSGLGL